MNEVVASETVGAPASAGAGTVRVLGRDDLAATVAILSADPVENVFVAARVRSAGIEPAALGCSMWGYERDQMVRSLCHAGFNLVPVNADEAAVAAFVEFAGPNRMCSSIFGPSTVEIGRAHV